MKKSIVLLGMIAFASSAFAQTPTLENLDERGGLSGNGGDQCEQRYQEIKGNLKSWIEVGNHRGLTFAATDDQSSYASKMLAVIETATVSCTSDRIFVRGVEKTCENKITDGKIEIRCNFDRFLNPLLDQELKDLSDEREDLQYLLVHHEYAGSAGYEVNTTAKSDYHLSLQLSAKLEQVLVKKLPIVPMIAFQPGSDDYERAKQLFDRAILYPQETVSSICSHEWVPNKHISPQNTSSVRISVLGGIEGYTSKVRFCRNARDAVIGTPIDQAGSTVESVRGNSDADSRIDHIVTIEDVDIWASSGRPFKRAVYTLSKDARTWTTQGTYFGIYRRRQRLALGLSRREAKNIPVTVKCTVTRAPLSLICKNDYDPVLNKAPTYSTFFAH